MKYTIREDKRKENESILYGILRNRGIENPDHYLRVTEADIINPASIKNMHEAARCLVYHIAAQHDIFVNVDSDCDGYTSAAFMINYLYKFFPGFTQQHVSWAMHDDKGHGLLMKEIEQIRPQLVICPDAGSNEFDKHEILKRMGVDVIIIDHHNTTNYSEDAIVINNQLDDGYPTKSLSGVGMVYKFCSYIDEMNETSYAKEMLDLAALGIIADVMELKDYETHELISLGLTNINNPFLKAMVAKNEYSLKSDQPSPEGVAWYIAPSVNAVTRVGTQQEKECLFESMLEQKAYTLVPSIKRGHKPGDMETIVEQAVRTCTNVKKRQDKARDTIFDEVCKKIQNEHLDQNKIILIKWENPTEESKSITGLIANKVMSKYGHPVMLLNQTFDPETGEVLWAGSGRNPVNDSVPSLQEFANDSGFFSLAQGHDNALGLAILDSNVDKFIAYSNEKLKDADFGTSYVVDVSYLPNKIDNLDILEIADAKDLWGQGVEEPLVLIQGVPITEDNTKLFGSTLKITFPSGLSAVKFNVSEDEYKNLLPSSIDQTVMIDVIGTCARNTGWDNGPQLMIKDYDILGTQWYF